MQSPRGYVGLGNARFYLEAGGVEFKLHKSKQMFRPIGVISKLCRISDRERKNLSTAAGNTKKQHPVGGSSSESA